MQKARVTGGWIPGRCVVLLLCFAVPLVVAAAVGVLTALGVPTGRGVPVIWPAAIAFVLSATLFLWLSGRSRVWWLVSVFIYGLTFPYWSAWLGLLTLGYRGYMGHPHSLLTGILIGLAGRSERLGAACALAIIPSWVLAGITEIAADHYYPARVGGRGDWDMIDYGALEFGLFWWNVLVSVILAMWAYRRYSRRAIESAAAAGICTACRYDLTGLNGEICPECGQ